VTGSPDVAPFENSGARYPIHHHSTLASIQAVIVISGY
jgi:hypothetical protein